MTWDPKTYLAFEAERTRPAGELLARVANENPRWVIDLGCGPGNSTALLAARWPEAELEGLDNSAEMLAQAAASGVRAQWIEASVSDWSSGASYDVIFANAAFQWVEDHEVLLPRLMSFLSPKGTLAFQVPRNFEEPCHTILRELADQPRYKAKVARVRNWETVLSPEAYFRILEPNAERIDIWETRYLQALDGEDAVFRWMSGTGLRPFANALEGEDRETFLAAYKERLNAAYPRLSSGKTLYPFQRLFVVAER
jgi:trans-aconitate 2-methyltransferase